MQTMMVDYFPRAHTAIAEWLACILFMLPLKKRIGPVQLAMLYAGTLAAFFVTNQDHFPWLLIVVLDMLYMLLMFRLGCRLTWTEIGYHWSHAFIASEFAASAEWQINYYLITAGTVTAGWQTYICMGVVYALVYSGLFLLDRRSRRTGDRIRIAGKEVVSALAIVLVAFFISNFNFAFRDNVFSESLGAGVLYSRTLVDFGGLVMLYAHRESRREVSVPAPAPQRQPHAPFENPPDSRNSSRSRKEEDRTSGKVLLVRNGLLCGLSFQYVSGLT